MWKIATRISALGLAVGVATGVGYAQPGRHAPGGFGGGGAAHFAAPHFAAGPHFAAPHFAAPHFAAPHFAAPHFAAPHYAAPHFAGRHFAAPHFAAPRVSHYARHVGAPAFRHAIHPRVRTAHVRPSVVHPGQPTAAVHAAMPHVAHVAPVHVPAVHMAGRAGARAFTANRKFVHAAALRPFFHFGWHRHHHFGWVGPLFWPYAYADFFYYALWPYEYWYYDPFWAYGYADIYEGIFFPYSYEEYVTGARAPARMAALQQGVAEVCAEDVAEVTGWPIDEIRDAVEPNSQQNALLDDLGTAIVKASDLISSHCPTSVSFTPTGRIAQMQQRLEGMVQASDIVEPPLAKFYDSLSDEQKARLNDIAASPPRRRGKVRRAMQNPQAECKESVMAWPNDRVAQVVQPSDAQRVKLDALDAAAAQAADLIKAACPTEIPGTPPDRLTAEGKRLSAMLAAVQTIRPKLDDFYNSLSDEQKARFNSLGRQLFAQK